MTILKAAVIGVGSMGSRHARVYAELPETKLVAVVGASETNCVRVAHQYACKAYTDCQEMLAVEQPDVVTVAVPTVFHLDVTRVALAAGCHVLIEKPIAASVDEAQTLIAAAAAAHRKLMVGHIVRFDSAVQSLKQRIADGELGHIFQIFCRRISPFPPRIRDVGVVVDLAPHDLDVMHYLIGEEPQRVYAETARRIHAEYEDQLAATLSFPSGIIGMLEINWLAPTKVRDVIVLSERGIFRADTLQQELSIEDNAGCRIIPPLQRHDPLEAEITAFVAAVLNDTPVPVPGADGLTALKSALALIQSGIEHRPVKL